MRGDGQESEGIEGDDPGCGLRMVWGTGRFEL